MIPSSVLEVSTDGERMMCNVFPRSETACLGSFEFIADYFGGLILSTRTSDSGTTFMGSTRSRTPSLWWAMIEDSTEEFHMATSR
jgi:hypothetical protein